jgi:hypothetical protein
MQGRNSGCDCTKRDVEKGCNQGGQWRHAARVRAREGGRMCVREQDARLQAAKSAAERVGIGPVRVLVEHGGGMDVDVLFVQPRCGG